MIAREERMTRMIQPLSATQCAVLRLLGEGLILSAAAQRLGISERAARTHVHRAMSKMGAATRMEAVAKHPRVHRRCSACANR